MHLVLAANSMRMTILYRFWISLHALSLHAHRRFPGFPACCITHVYMAFMRWPPTLLSRSFRACLWACRYSSALKLRLSPPPPSVSLATLLATEEQKLLSDPPDSSARRRDEDVGDPPRIPVDSSELLLPYMRLLYRLAAPAAPAPSTSTGPLLATVAASRSLVDSIDSVCASSLLLCSAVRATRWRGAT